MCYRLRGRFDLRPIKPDLDNANVGMCFTVSFQSGSLLFYFGGFMIKVNGIQLDIAGKTLFEYLQTTEYNLKRIAVERNGEIVPKAEYEKTVLNDGDSLEVVSFVGGG